ncbi:MAG: urease accessory protein UreF [Thioalkalispiraceae bacterium]|jgi:urease accessory protein
MKQNHSSSFSMLRLWQLISPALPVGAYAYSQGLEYAIDANWVTNKREVQEWIKGQLCHNLAHLDIPVLRNLYSAWQADDLNEVEEWAQFLVASREASELLAEDLHLGRALATLLHELGVPSAESFKFSDTACFAVLLSLAAVHWQITVADIASGYLWSWSENQVAAAIKLVPLGQTDGQKILSAVSKVIPDSVATGLALANEEIGMLAPGVAMASALHETQYSRLFRS